MSPSISQLKKEVQRGYLSQPKAPISQVGEPGLWVPRPSQAFLKGSLKICLCPFQPRVWKGGRVHKASTLDPCVFSGVYPQGAAGQFAELISMVSSQDIIQGFICFFCRFHKRNRIIFFTPGAFIIAQNNPNFHRQENRSINYSIVSKWNPTDQQ